MFNKVFSWICLILGGLGVIGSIYDNNSMGLLGSIMFITAGAVIQDLINKK